MGRISCRIHDTRKKSNVAALDFKSLPKKNGDCGFAKSILMGICFSAANIDTIRFANKGINITTLICNFY